MKFRIATLNMEQDRHRWSLRRDLIIEELAALDPDVFAMNEVCIPEQTARWIQQTMRERHGREYALVQQSKTNGTSVVEGEALLTRLPIVETANLDYRARDTIALVARLKAGERLVDVYVTHLSPGANDALRLFQVERLSDWIASRDDAHASVVCGDFNAMLDAPSAQLMTKRFRPSQTEPTAFTPLSGKRGMSHPNWPRMDRCIDYIWLDASLKTLASEVCYNKPSPNDPTLYPSDHAGIYADVAVG